MKRSFFILMLTLLSAVSCSIPRYVPIESSLQEQWPGRTHAEVIREFGAPDREISDGADGVVLVYERTTTTTRTEEFMERYTTTIEENRVFKEFYIGADGICYNVRSNESLREEEKVSVLGPIVGITLVGLVPVLFLNDNGVFGEGGDCE